MNYRFAKESDLYVVISLNEELTAIDEPQVRFSVEDILSRLKRWIAEGHQLVLFENNGDVVGYALYALGHRLPGETLIYLRHFIIAKTHRGKGLGRSAMEHLMSEVWPKNTLICVDTRVNNIGAFRF